MALLAGLGALLGAANNSKAARTSTTSTTGSNSSSGASSPTFSSGQTAMQGSLGNALQNEITNGPDITPLATSGTNAINQTYQGIGDRLNESLSSRGFGNSGSSGTAALQTQLGRAGAVGDLQSNLQGYAMQQQQTAMGQGLGYSFAAPGSTFSKGSTGSSYGTSVGPGSPGTGAAVYGISGLLAGLNQASNLGGLG